MTKKRTSKIGVIGDIHMGHSSPGYTLVAEHSREKSRTLALEAALVALIDSGVEAIFLAGDIFDTKKITHGTYRRVAELVTKYRSRACIIPIHGNHDAEPRFHDPEDQTWVRGLRKVAETPELLGSLKMDEETGWETYSTHGGHTVLFGGYVPPAEMRQVLAALRQRGGLAPDLLVSHMLVADFGKTVSDKHLPNTLTGQDFSGAARCVVLGDFHKRTEISGDPHIHYPGLLHFKGFSDRDEGVLIVDIDDEKVVVSPPKAKAYPEDITRWVQGRAEIKVFPGFKRDQNPFGIKRTEESDLLPVPIEGGGNIRLIKGAMEGCANLPPTVIKIEHATTTSAAAASLAEELRAISSSSPEGKEGPYADVGGPWVVTLAPVASLVTVDPESQKQVLRETGLQMEDAVIHVAKDSKTRKRCLDLLAGRDPDLIFGIKNMDEGKEEKRKNKQDKEECSKE